jgi:hypothetical protein
MQVRGTLRQLALGALVLGATAALTGCVVPGGGYAGDGGYHDDYRDYPPASPQHGYRYAYPGGLSLIYDSGLGMYGVYGYPDYYYTGGYFYRWNSGHWNRSRHWNRNWQRCDSRHYPRPIYRVNNNYYAKGHRPRRDWDRGGHDDRDRRDGPREQWDQQHQNRDRDRDNDRDDDRDGVRERWENRGTAARPAPRAGDEGGRGPVGDWRGRTTERGNDDAILRERGAQTRQAPPPQTRERNERNEVVARAETARRERESAVRDQGLRQAAARAAAEQQGRERADREARAERQAAEQRQREESARQERSSDDGDNERSTRGGSRGDNWREDRR